MTPESLCRLLSDDGQARWLAAPVPETDGDPRLPMTVTVAAVTEQWSLDFWPSADQDSRDFIAFGFITGMASLLSGEVLAGLTTEVFVRRTDRDTSIDARDDPAARTAVIAVAWPVRDPSRGRCATARLFIDDVGCQSFEHAAVVAWPPVGRFFAMAEHSRGSMAGLIGHPGAPSPQAFADWYGQQFGEVTVRRL